MVAIGATMVGAINITGGVRGGGEGLEKREEEVQDGMEEEKLILEKKKRKRVEKEKGVRVEKGDEWGYFAFGGSTLIILFQKNAIEFDQELVLNSSKPIETRVYMGERIGVSKNKIEEEGTER